MGEGRGAPPSPTPLAGQNETPEQSQNSRQTGLVGVRHVELLLLPGHSLLILHYLKTKKQK